MCLYNYLNNLTPPSPTCSTFSLNDISFKTSMFMHVASYIFSNIPISPLRDNLIPSFLSFPFLCPSVPLCLSYFILSSLSFFFTIMNGQ